MAAEGNVGRRRLDLRVRVQESQLSLVSSLLVRNERSKLGERLKIHDYQGEAKMVDVSHASLHVS